MLSNVQCRLLPKINTCEHRQLCSKLTDFTDDSGENPPIRRESEFPAAILEHVRSACSGAHGFPQKQSVSMSTPQVSVIIPCYNGSEDVTGAIDCALAQTNCAAEVLVINDGSTDRSAEVLDSYGDRIRAIHQSNKGLAATRNVGIELARGEWVAFLDHDDLWLPGKLESQLKVAADQNADVVYTNTENFGEIDRIDTVRSDPNNMHPAICSKHFSWITSLSSRP